MNKVWRKIVKQGMRNQNLLCLHDYFDYQRNYAALNLVIRDQILRHEYRPKPPHVIRLEKKYGVCRHIQIPAPSDAVVLQTLVERLSSHIKNNQPSPKAFYSRSHSNLKTEEDIDDSFSYQWWELWPEFQKKIYEFSTSFNYVVVTDVANYFDTISFDRLRNVLASYARFDECLLDFLFFMLDFFMWKPDYLPLSGIGLPQINFDAPRLLAHAFLFEIDKYLDGETDGNFVRWMDDIDFGVQDIESAKKVLRGLDELLLTRGLRLNLGKTKILSSEDAKKYFLPNENRYLTIMSKRINEHLEKELNIEDEKRKVRGRFKKFLDLSNAGRWEKVYKRYFTISCKTKDEFLEEYVPDLLESSPGLRENILRYYASLGVSEKRFHHLENFLESYHCLDDVAPFSVAKLLVEWKITPNSLIKNKIVSLAIKISNRSSSHLLSSIWLLAKYGSESELCKILDANVNVWKYSGFLSRQVAATIPRIRDSKYKDMEKIFSETGQLESLRILYNLNEIRARPLSKGDILYILHQSKSELYPLSKFLILIDILNSETIDSLNLKSLKNELLNRIKDPIYLWYLQNLKI
ncbi:RNA-directed DNA polymerase [Geitlerinema sp. PCC 7407]|uniref:RNA-directed DNA polymerase n=1 Tax=Geitlerinema sp. PCC 7407 TaxID=1173025 RepID=UPI001CBCB3BE|nr:RNA-directed DNA polymerase [Geitlerinema sp. PCC 7407]